MVAASACLGYALPHNELATPPYVKPAAAWLETHAQDTLGATIFTNSPEFAAALPRSPAIGGAAVRFIVAPDMTWEIAQLSNPANGQRAALERIARTELFPPSVVWNEIAPDSIPPRSLFVLRDDPRLPLLMPAAVWGGRVEQIGRGDSFTVGRLVPAAAPGAALQ
jgi:hypothetical protein